MNTARTKLPLEFAFEGFRIIRHFPTVILFWGVIALVSYAANATILQGLAGTAVQDLQTASQSQDMAAMMAAFSKLLPAYALLIPISIVINAVLSCAVFRAVAGTPGGFGGIRVGIDEVRQIGVSILFFLIVTGLYIVAAISAGFVAAIGGFAFSAISKPLGTVAVVIAIFGVALVFFWFVARLSLAPAQSFAERRITMFGSWKLTEGQSVPLIIGYVIALVMAALVALLCLGIFMAGLAILHNGDALAVGRIMNSARDFGAILHNPAVLTYVIIMNLVVTPLLMAITLGAPASAYRLLSGRASVDSVF